MRAVCSAGALAHPQHVIIRRARAAACSVLLSAPVVPVPQTICSGARARVPSHSSLRGSRGV